MILGLIDVSWIILVVLILAGLDFVFGLISNLI